MLLAAGALMSAAVAEEAPKLTPFNVGNDAFVNGMSPNGKWGTYQKQAGEELSLDVKIINLETGEFVTYTPKKKINYKGVEEAFLNGSYSQPMGVSNDGKIIYGTVDGYPAYFTVDDLTWHCLSMGSTADNRNLSGAVYGMNGDGTLMAGWFSGESLTLLKSALWENGVKKDLPGLPTYKDLYDRGIIDKYDYESSKNETPNYTFRTISFDGKKLLLGIDHNRPDWGCSYGVYDLENETFAFILAPAETYGHSFTDSAYLSENGEWVTGNMMFIGADQEGYDDKEGVYRYNTNTGKLEVFCDLPDQDMLATAIDNNGTVYAANPGSQPIRNLVVRSEDLWVDLNKILDQKYGINFSEATDYTSTGYAQNVAADCKTLLVQAEFRGGAYALTLPVEYNEAAKGISLLTEYTVAPASGKQFSTLKQMRVRFTYGAVPVDGAEVTVKDEGGNVVGKSSAITSFSSQNLLYTITFPDIKLAAGKKYTVSVPEGIFTVPGTTMGNPKFDVEYIGRPDQPVKAVNINPAEDSYINVFSFNSPVTIDFDTDLSISTAVQPQLFEEGKNNAICNLSVVADGNRLIIYPASERRLAKDHKYRIEIPASLVADISAEGYNEAFSINYNGAFVPTTPSDPARPFFEDFTSPNEALYNFLLIDGDGNMPSETMQGYGFDANNTPWNFSLRDDDNYDYCAASHSEYSPAGRSDDWMMLPQLKLSDKDFYLTFKAQSATQSKYDRLKIVVWEFDDVLGSLDEDMLARVKKEAKTLAEFQLIPSKVEGLLAGNWTNYEFPLADYAGKNVYIAFVNENNNQSMVFVDDIAVEYRGAYTLSVATENNLVEANTTSVVADIAVNAAGPFKELEATLTIPELDYSQVIKKDALNLTTGSTYQVKFVDVPLQLGKVNKFTVETVMNGIKQTYTGNIVNHAFEIQRRVLIEEGTGMWCGNCPYGEVALEHLQETMPDNIAVISVHNGDAFAHQEYDQLLALGGYPNGRVNRLPGVYSPMFHDETTGDVAYTSNTGDQTFMDMVLSELSAGTEGEIKVVDPTYYSADGVIELPIETRFSVTRDNVIYTIFVCVVEDELPGRQKNYFSGTTSEVMSWWGAQPSMVTYTYSNVAREMPYGFYGVSKIVPTSVDSGETYKSNLKFELPKNVTDTDNMHFVVALLDGTTGKAVNTAVCREFAINDTPDASIDTVIDDVVKAVVTVANGTIMVNGDADVEVYGLNGMYLRNGNLSNGIYIIRKVLADGNVFTGRVLVQ